MEIYIDDREKSITTFISEIDTYQIPHTIKRLAIGDYAIVNNHIIIAIIERKTWADLAASFFDGRKENIEKLKKLRVETGCKILYLIEGNPFHPPNKKIHRMPFKNMESHLDHLIFRDDVHVLYAKNGTDCIQRIFGFARNLGSIKPKTDVKNITVEPATDEKNEITAVTTEITEVMTEVMTEVIAATDEKTEASVGTTEVEEQDQKVEVVEGAAEAFSASSLFNLKRAAPEMAEIQIRFMRVLGAGVLYAEALYSSGFTLRKLYSGEDFSAVTYKGRKPNSKMIDAMKKNISQRPSSLQIKLLSEVPSISSKTATKLLTQCTFDELITSLPVETLAAMQRTEKTKVGNLIAATILKYLRN